MHSWNSNSFLGALLLNQRFCFSRVNKRSESLFRKVEEEEEECLFSYGPVR